MEQILLSEGNAQFIVKDYQDERNKLAQNQIQQWFGTLKKNKKYKCYSSSNDLLFFCSVVCVHHEEQFCRGGFREIRRPESALQVDCPQSAGLEDLVKRSGAAEEKYFQPWYATKQLFGVTQPLLFKMAFSSDTNFCFMKVLHRWRQILSLFLQVCHCGDFFLSDAISEKNQF